MSVPSVAKGFFEVGGALDPDAPSYVTRQADDGLLHAVLSGQYCNVLTARQMGKTSLMVSTKRRLQSEGVRTVTIDLDSLGTELSASEWYFGLVSRFKRQLGLSVDEKGWWSERDQLGPVQRFSDFLRQIVLEEVQEPIVVFIDEIDSTLNLPFTDDFFAAIRAAYNARARDPAYKRVTFVLLGVTLPSDLIKDRTRTPYNIGTSIDLHDFTPEEAQVLLAGLDATDPEQAKPVLARVLHWTGGHPYLTQKICAGMQSGDGHWTDEQIDDLVEQLFLTEEVRKETNLERIRERIQESRERGRMLRVYRRVWAGKRVQDEERSVVKSQLKLTGLVRAERGALEVRNEIYRRAFNWEWIKANTPVDWTQRIAVASTLLAIVLAVTIGWLIPRQRQQTAEARAQAFVDSFRSTTSAAVRINSLSGLFELPGYEEQAHQLFQELSPEQQLALFDLTDPQEVGEQLIVVVQGLYADVELYSDLEQARQWNTLLRAMTQSLRKLDNPLAVNLATQIEQWVQGRAYHEQGDYQQAITAYEVAISLNDRNPGTCFDRGRAYVGLKDYQAALDDFGTVIQLDPEWLPQVQEAIEGNAELFEYLGTHRDDYPDLATPFPTLTPTPTPTNTSTPTPTPTPTHTATPTTAPTARPTPTSTPPPPTSTVTSVPTTTPVPAQRPPKTKTPLAPTEPFIAPPTPTQT